MMKSNSSSVKPEWCADTRPIGRGRLSGESENVQRHGPHGLARAVHKSANLLSRLARERSFAAPFANLHRDPLHEHSSSLHHKHFAHEVGFCRCVPADVALKHGYLRVW